MAVPIGPGRRSPTPLCVVSGLELLEQWSGQATQVEKNIVHQVLFAVVDRSVFDSYDVVDDVTKTMEFFVLCRCDLTVKIRVHDFETCGITYVGPTCAAPGLDQAAPEARSSSPEPSAGTSLDGKEASPPGQEQGVRHRI